MTWKCVLFQVPSPGPGVPVMEHKWVDLLVKSYVKVGRVAEAVELTDVQLSGVSKGTEKDRIVRARVALNVYPWRRGVLSTLSLNHGGS